MNAVLTYRRQQQQPNAGSTRIDLLLTVYNGAIERMTRAEGLLKLKDRQAAIPLLARAQLLVSELAAGVRLDVDAEMGTNMLRLYEFVVHQLKQSQPQNIADAIKIMKTLREGFEAIREEAIQMERRGELNSADTLRQLSTVG